MQDELSSRDWRELLESVQKICLCEGVTELQETALECVRGLIPSRQGIFFVSREGKGEGDDPRAFCRPVVVGAKARYIDEFLQGRYTGDEDRDFFFCGEGHLGKEAVTFRASDKISERYLESTRIYREMYVPQGIHYALRSFLFYKGRPAGLIILFNAKEQGDFTDRQTEILAILAPYVAKRLGMLVEEERAAGSGFDKAYWKKNYLLTPRELEIASLIVEGVADVDITSALCITPATFKKHVYNIYRKLGVNDRAGLFRRYLDAEGR